MLTSMVYLKVKIRVNKDSMTTVNGRDSLTARPELFEHLLWFNLDSFRQICPYFHKLDRNFLVDGLLEGILWYTF